MSQRYHRAQILLDPEHHERLRRIAEQEDTSISGIARELISAGLERLAVDEQRKAERRANALKRMRAIRETARDRYGVYEGDLIAQVKAGRE